MQCTSPMYTACTSLCVLFFGLVIDQDGVYVSDDTRFPGGPHLSRTVTQKSH